jgi:hypothetical protein
MNKSDIEMLIAISQEMADRFKLIITIFPDEDKYQHLLKNVAAASIHMALFAQDLVGNEDGTKCYTPESKDKINKFLDQCGCKIKELTIEKKK